MSREEYLDLLLDEIDKETYIAWSQVEEVIKAIFRLKAKRVEIPDEVFEGSVRANKGQLSKSNR